MAFKNIRGLTVEISGDTTKLGKALEDVNKKSRSISTELGEINKLLRMDPGNTDLLSQKQKVLSDAISNTAKKLDTLKEAERQVQEQFERGEVSEQQVRDLQREIIATTKKLDGYEQAAKETEKALKGVGDETKEVTEKSGKLGQALGNAAKVGLQAVAAAATAAIGGLIAAAESTREYRTEMGKLDTAFATTGKSSETAAATYKTLQGVIGETDQSVEAAQQIALLAASEEDAAKWAEQAAGVVGRFGDALQPETFFEAANETIKLGEATGAYTQMLEGVGYDVDKFNEGLAACTTEGEKQAYMLRITDELLGDAADRYRETNEEIIRANEANEAWTASMADAGGAIEPIITDVKMMGASLLSDLVPGVQQLADAFRGLLSGDLGAASGIGGALSGIITSILTKATELAPTLAQAAVSLVTSLSTTLLTMLPQLVITGVDVIMALIQGLTSAIPQVVQAIGDMIPQLVDALVSAIPLLVQGAVQLFMALTQSVPLIIPPLVAALPEIIVAIIDALTNATPQLLDAAVALLMSVVEAIPEMVKELAKALPKVWEAMKDFFSTVPGKLWDILLQVVQKVVDCGREMANKGKAAAKSLVDSVVNGIKALPNKVLTIGKDLVTGLWNGITNKLSWLKSKLKSFTNSVLDSIKGFFGVHSPSKETAWIGEMLDEGLAQGVEDAAQSPVRAMQRVSGSVLDAAATEVGGIGFERSLRTTAPTSVAASASVSNNAALLAKLDGIYERLGRLQMVTDTGVLVGEMLDKIDAALGNKQMLAARGVS